MFPPPHDIDLRRMLARDRIAQLRADWRSPLPRAGVASPRAARRRWWQRRPLERCVPCTVEPEPFH